MPNKNNTIQPCMTAYHFIPNACVIKRRKQIFIQTTTIQNRVNWTIYLNTLLLYNNVKINFIKIKYLCEEFKNATLCFRIQFYPSILINKKKNSSGWLSRTSDFSYYICIISCVISYWDLTDYLTSLFLVVGSFRGNSCSCYKETRFLQCNQSFIHQIHSNAVK